MFDLAKHIVAQQSGDFEPEKFEDHYETALIDLINAKRNEERPSRLSPAHAISP
jgi:DNA end-binding protein Ku